MYDKSPKEDTVVWGLLFVVPPDRVKSSGRLMLYYIGFVVKQRGLQYSRIHDMKQEKKGALPGWGNWHKWGASNKWYEKLQYLHEYL